MTPSMTPCLTVFAIRTRVAKSNGDGRAPRETREDSADLATMRAARFLLW
jgi:hypothetical protein